MKAEIESLNSTFDKSYAFAGDFYTSMYPLCSALCFREIVGLLVVEEKDFGPSKWCHFEFFSGSRKRVKWWVNEKYRKKTRTLP